MSISLTSILAPEILFSGLGATVIGIGITYFIKHKRSNGSQTNNTTKGNNTTQNNKKGNNNSNSLVINNYVRPEELPLNKDSNTPIKYSPKSKTNILFIDDDTKFRIVSILKKAGWDNTRLKKDIVNLDDTDAQNADIIFVDINGVGVDLFPKDQGLGLAVALKEKYSNKKIIIYSAETTGDRFHKAFKIVDDYLPKNADPYQFIHIVETYTGN